MWAVAEWASLEEWWTNVGEAELTLILWAAWDPIGMVPRDEYEWYVPRIFEMLRKGASKEEIAAQLGQWRTERIGVPANPEHDLIVAWKLTDWIDPPGLPEFKPIQLMR